MSAKSIKLGPQFRTFNVTRENVNVEERTIELSFSSELPVERHWGIEILDHGNDSCDLSRLNSGGALLVEHDTRDQVGVIVRAFIRERRGYAIVRFGSSARANEIFQDVKDGIRQLVSVGYRIGAVVLESVKDGLETYRVTSFQPYEISLVSVPADNTVGVGRGAEIGEREIPVTNTTNTETNMKNIRLNPDTANGGGGSNIDVLAEKRGVDAERKRAGEIRSIGNQHRGALSARGVDVSSLADSAIEAGKSADEFRADVLTKYGAQPVASGEAKIGMSDSEARSFSIIRAINLLAAGKPLDGIEGEASRAVAKLTKRDPGGFFIPHDVACIGAKRALTATVASAGGYTVGTDTLGGSLIELLRNRTVVSQLGARQLSGLVGDVAIPKVTGGATAYWLSETATATDSQQTFGQLGLSPRRLVATTPFSKQLLAQSSVDIEGLVRDDLMRVLAIEKDRAAINGSGAAGEPRGIMNVTGINTVTFSAAPTWAKVVSFETAIASDNADVQGMAYVTTPAVRGAWKTTVKTSGQAIFLWEGAAVNGYRAEVTNQVPSDKVIFGNFADLILADWAGWDVVVDPYTLAKSGQVQVTITIMTDVGVRHPESFAVSTDAGNQ